MSSFSLKTIALLTMIIDHTGATLAVVFDSSFMRLIGRVAFPIYAFLIAEGCRHTKNIQKYLLRLALFAIISEPAFDLLFANVYSLSDDLIFIEFGSQNVFFTLTLGVAAIYCIQLCKNSGLAWMGYILALYISFLGDVLRTDYGSKGVLLIIGCYVFEKRIFQVIVIAVFIFVKYWTSQAMLAFTMLSLLFIILYNGKQGCTKGKLIFYVAYPAHILMLYVIYLLFLR